MSRTPLFANVLIAAATVAFVVANAFYSIYCDFTNTVAEHEVMARDLVSVVADQVARSIRDTDLALRQVGEIAQSGNGLQVFREKKEWEALFRISERIPGGVGIVVADLDGKVTAMSSTAQPPPLSVADRDYMAALVERDILYVGPAVVSRLDENKVIYTVSRRLNDRRGKMIGVAVAGVATSHLTDFYDLFGFKKDPGVAIFRSNGDIIARRPNVKEYIGQNIGHRPLFQVRVKQSAEGLFRARSPMDGIDRINAYRVLEESGMVVLVGIPWQAIAAEWQGRAWRIGVLALTSILGILFAARWGHASIRKAIQAQSEREEAVAAREGAYQALHHALLDHLTGLPARALFLEQANDLREKSRSSGDKLAIMIVDLDDFKNVNDTFGHHRGDDVLTRAATILSGALRETDIAGRLGGDEFGVCITAPADFAWERASSVARQIVENVDRIGMGIGCSIGVALFPAACETLSCALRRADEAMYVAKRSGKNQFAIWGGARPDGKEWVTQAFCQREAGGEPSI